MDAGLDAASDNYFAVMALAEFSLTHRLREAGPFNETDTLAVLQSVAEELREVGDLNN